MSPGLANGLPRDFSLSGRANSLCPYAFLDTTLQIAHHVEELTRSRMQSLLCARAYPVEEFTPLLSTLCARSYSGQEYTPLLSSPCARVYPVEECTPLLSLPIAQEFTLRADSHLTVYHLFGSSPLQRMPMSLGRQSKSTHCVWSSPLAEFTSFATNAA